MSPKMRTTLVALAMSLYIASLALPTVAPFNPEVSDTVYNGWYAFEGGWRALLAFEPERLDWWVLAAACIVNPLVLVAAGATLAGRRLVAGPAAWAAVVLSLPVLFRFDNVIVGHPGYWCWLGAATLLAIGSAWRRSHTEQTTGSVEPKVMHADKSPTAEAQSRRRKRRRWLFANWLPVLGFLAGGGSVFLWGLIRANLLFAPPLPPNAVHCGTCALMGWFLLFFSPFVGAAIMIVSWIVGLVVDDIRGERSRVLS